MSRLAVPVFAIALALYLGGVVLTAKEPRPEHFDTPLDTTGVRSVEIRAKDPVDIAFCTDGKPRVTADNDGGTKVTANRSGDRLVVIVRVEFYDEVDVCLPAGVRELRVGNASVTTAKGVTVDDLRIVASRRVGWDGQAGRLRLEALARPSNCKEDCRGNVSAEGSIDSLEVVAEAGEATVTRPETMGAVSVALGPTSTIAFEDTRDPARVRITDLAGRAPRPACNPRRSCRAPGTRSRPAG
jgi:hypothetical protein